MLFHTLLAPESATYVSQLTCTLPADLDPGRFRQAWETLVRRHGVLRTAFLSEGLDEPLQAVRKTVSVPWQELDWRGLPEDVQERRFTDLCHRERHTPFSLTRAPLLRFSLVHLGRRTGFVWTLHHLLLDGWSLPLLVRELTIVYAALQEGREPALPPVRPFGDYVVWLKKQDPARAETFWRGELAGFTAPNALGVLGADRPARAHGASGYAEHGLQISRAATARLQTLASRHKLTLQTVTLGAWAVLVSRYSGDEDVVFGNVVSGRPAALPGVETMVGMFINTLPVRARVNGAELLAPWLQRLQERQLARQEFEQAPLAEIQRWSEVPAGSPLFETLYVFENYPNAGAGGSNSLRIGDLRSFESTNYPVTLTLTAADHVSLRLAYDRARMDEDSALRLLGHLGRLLAGIGERPEQALRDLSLLSEAELHQVRAEWNDTASFFPQEATLHSLFAEQVELLPEAVAVAFEGEELTYSELDRRANRLARQLRDRGCGPESRVGVLLERSCELLVALLGILKAGAAYVPLDPDHPSDRLAFQDRDARLRWIVTRAGLADRLPGAEDRFLFLPAGGDLPLSVAVDPDHPAYVLYTSGSTGRPKGVVISHRAIVNRLHWGQEVLPLTAADRVLHKTPISFDVSVWELFWPLMTGARLVLARPGGHRDNAYLARLIAGQGITMLHFVPSMLQLFLEEPEAGECRTLHDVACGGEALTAELARRFAAGLGHVRLHNFYGPTEAAVEVTSWVCDAAGDDRDDRGGMPIGRPVFNTRIHLLDRNLLPVPVGVPGELFIAGVNLARGYVERPDLTAERFLPDPEGREPGERAYRTGDLARWRAGGAIEYLGRLDHQVKIRGVRIELGEIEATLAALPGVREAVVVVREDVPGDRRLVAYVVADAQVDAPVETLRRSLRERLPDAMMPSAFVTLAALPLTSNGKVDRKALLSPGAAAGQQGFEESHLESYVAPRTPVEEVLAGIWAEVLGRERVGVADSFFGLGGHSLLATRVTSRLRKAFGVELPLRDLFETATLAELAMRVERALRAGAGALAPPLAAAPRQGPQPLSFAQQRLWFIDRLEPGSPLYNMPVALRVQGRLDAAALARTLGEIVRRHEALRTVFAVSEGGDGTPVQVIQPAARFSLPVVDLAGAPEQAHSLITAEAARPFDLADPGGGPLLRSLLLRLAPDDHVVALTLHHIASDAWSTGILVREVAALYAALSEDTAGRPSPLPELPVQYADFAVWQRSWLQGEVLEREIAYWKQHLAGLPPLLELPTDRPRPAVQSFRGAGRPVRLPAGLTRQLEALARREGATLFMVLLAGFEVLLAHTSGQEDFAVGSPIAGRNRVEIEGLIGFFVNTLVLRGDLSGDRTGGSSFRELLGRVRETALAAYVHQDVPFEKLVEELAPERSLARSPLFQVMFALQNAPVESLEIPGLQLRPVSGGAATVKFDLELDLREQDSGLFGMVGYATDLFDSATIDRLVGHFERTLAAALATPELPVAALPFLTGAERHQLLVEWNDTEIRSLPGCLHHDVAAQAARTPDAVAVEMGTERWTYRRLIGGARRLARHLRVLGIGPDGVVGLCAERSPAMVVGMLAVLEAGGAWLPLDPGHPAERLAFMLQDAGAQVLLIQESLRERIPAAGLPVVLLDGRWDSGEGSGDDSGEETVEALGVEVSPDHLAYVIYTSGSTGQPKGVMVPHRGVCNRLRWAQQVYRLDERDAFLHKAASGVDVSVWECFAPLVAGARLVLAEPGRQGESAYLIRTIREHRVTLVDFVPSMLAVFLDEAEVETCVSLRQVFVGGEALSPELRDRMAARLPIPLDNMYGPTEITIDTTRWVCAPGRSPQREPIGRPIGNSRLYVVDRGLRALPLGVSGELVVGGEGVTRGYLGRPGLSAERFVPDPLGGRPGGRLYRTGDLARCREDGAIEFLGRLDHQVKIRGVRIELGEIEAALRLHPAVHDAVADVRGASASHLLTAWVVPREGGAIPAAADLRAFLRERLPDSMVPAAFVALAALPLTPSGKVDRKVLPAPGQAGSGGLFVAPRTPVEELLAAIWSDVLGVDRVGVADSFFDLGGHSLLATQVMSRLRRTFGVEMPLRDLFATPRLADLAVRVEAALAAGTRQAAPPLVRIAPDLRQGLQPLSFAQQRLWFIDQLDPGSALYNMPVALRVEGPLRCEVLRLTLSEIVRRHEALRTVFAVSEGGEGLPVQVVQPAAPFALPVVDLSGLPETEREALAAILAGEEGRRPFDLGDLRGGPLLHCLLLRLAPPGETADHAVALTMHHIASDGWSTGILVREVAALYAVFAEDRPSPLPELPVQYADFAVWQRSWLHGETLERELAYWRRELAGLPPLLELPTDRPRPAVQSYRGATRLVRLPAGLTGQMEALARREGATLFMVLLAGFQVLLARYSRQQDLAVGSPIAGRNRAEVEGLIGFFVNTLVLRGDLTGNRAGEPSSRELLRRVRRTALAAYTHQDVPFEKLVEELAPERSLAHAPLFQVMLVLQNAPAEGLEIPNLYLRPMATKGTAAKFDLTLGLQEWSGQLVGAIEYVTDLFDAATVERLAGHFERLLVTAVATPDVSALALPLLSSAECGQILREWNDTRVEGLAEGCLHDDVAAQAARTPSAVAVESGAERWTYRRLVSSARLLARHLRDLGVGPDAIVGLCAERSPGMVVGMLAVLETGGAYLPLDPAYPAERLAFMLDDSGAGVLLIQEHLLERVPTTGRRMVLLDARWDSDEEREALGVKVTPDHLAYVIYTSGSTGRPKGVMVPHRGVRNRLRWAQEVYRLDERDAVLQKASFSFDFSVWECFAPLSAGARLVLAEPGRQGDGPYLARVVREQRVTFVHFVPSLLAVFLDQEDGERFVSLRQVFVGGEALTPELRDRALARLSVPLDNQYGPTEISIDTTRWVCAPGQESYRSPIGRPIGNSRLYVVDPELRSTPIGVAGELLVGGAGVAHGYLRRPGLTAERFVPDPFHGDSGGRLYRTGDLVRWLPDGTLEFLGRLDHQVKVRGFRIELGEIETVLATLPGVREAVVAAREDTPGDRRLVAYVAGEVAEVTADALRQALRERLPDYMVPAAFVILPALPLTLSGKVDRRALPAPERQEPREGHLAPRTPVEEVLAGIWAELLGFERVGAADHFFDLGGHSLLATRVMSRLRSAFGVEMPLRDLFEAPVLADLAARVEAALRAGMGRLTPPLVPLAPDMRQGPQPLSFAQQRLWFIDQLEPGSALYNMPVALRVEGPLRFEALRLTLSEIVRRHEALRTVFAVSGGEEGSPVQRVQPAAPFELPVVDLSGLPESRRETAASALAGEEAGRPFDLTRDLMLHCLLLQLAHDDHAVALTLHHIASDGWSTGILVREVAALYAAFAEGRPSPLPELPVQYADFAVWQRSWLQGEVLEREIAYWKQHLAGLPPLLELPTDRPRPAVQSYRGAMRPARLPAGLTAQMEALARREGATLFMVLLAGFQALLARASGQEDLAVGSPIAGRNRVETEGLIGFFVNTLVMRGHLTGHLSFRELLARVRETALAAYVHQDVPFERLVEELAPERSLAHAPLFQVMLVLQNAPTESLEVRDLRLRPVDVLATTAKFDLTVSLEEHGGELAGFLEYSTSLFDGTTVDRLGGHLERLLAAAASTPDEPAFALPLTSPEERAQILAEWNDTAAASPSRTGVYELFASQARRTPEAVAVVFGDEELTYAGLAARAGRLARRLQRLGVGPDVPVGLLAERSLDMITGVLGILQAGGAYVPLDPAYPVQRLAFMLGDTRTPVLLTHTHLRDLLPVESAQVLLLDGDEDNRVAGSSSVVPGGEPSGDNLGYVTYTSGSTGRPKGVALSQLALCNLIDWHLATLLGGARTLQFASLSFDASFYEMFACWGSGGTLVVVPEDLRRDMVGLADLLVEQRIEKSILPVVVLQQLAEIFAGREDLPPLREITTTGERLQISRAMAALLPRLPGCAFHNHYGPSETHVATAFTLSPEPEDWEVYPSIGRPIGNSTAYVLETGLEPGLVAAPIGVPGDLYLGGVCLARGYLGRPDLTAERFVPDSLGVEPGARLYRTGDKVRLRTDGNLEYVGRFDDQVKIRGFRIEPGEIEALLMTLPGVEEAVVVMHEDRAGDRRLVAYVVGEKIVGEGLRRSLREKLPDYMVPAAVVVLPELPLTPNRKVDRKALPAPEGQGAGESHLERHLAPRTPVEEILAGIWAEVLGRERVGASDHFFDLGGHSLLATQVMSRLRGVFGIEMPLRDLFATPRLADLAVRVEAALAAGTPQAAPPLVRIAPDMRQGPQPLSFAQQRLWFIDRLEPGSALYNLPVALRVEGPLRFEVLRLTLGEIVRRHEALRTVFAVSEGGEGSPVQVVQPAAPFALPVVDLSGLPESRRETAASALAGEEAGRPFDLGDPKGGPLLRGVLLRVAEESCVLAFTLHHIASDGWSMGILVREVVALYAALSEDTAGRPSPLPELPVQYVDFAVWQRSWLQGEVLEREIAYWKQHLADLPPFLELPTDRPRPAVQSYRGATRPVRLRAGLTGQMAALARREGATLFMVLLAGFQALLARTSRQDDLAVGSPSAGRNRVEIEGLIGFFVNTLVLRGDLSREPSFREHLGRVRETALAAHAHQDLPFEKLVEELAPERSLAHAPLFQVMLALQNAPAGHLEIRGLRLHPVPVEGTTAKLDLTLSLAEHEGGLVGTLEHATDLYDGTTVGRLMGQLERLLAAAVSTPDEPVSALPLLSPEERGQILVEWNDTAAAPARRACLHELFEAQARRTPDAVALVDGERKILYRELEEDAERLASDLRRRGAGPEVVIGVRLERSAEMVIALLAILKAGSAYLPLDPQLPPARLEALVSGARVSLVLEGNSLAATGSGHRGTMKPPGEKPHPENLAYVLFTSGSTGTPKGVAVTHQSAVALVRWAGTVFTAEELAGVLASTSLSFDLSVFEIFVPLSWGGTVILAQNALALPELPARERVTLVNTVPSVMAELARGDSLGRSVRTVNLAGEPLPRALAAQIHATGTVERVYNLYGPSEDTTYSTFSCVARDGSAAPAIGRPITGTRAYVLAGPAAVPVGVAGELHLGGAGLARSYLHRPDLTAERFIPDLFAAEPGARLYRTGDLVRWTAAGDLEFLGRTDQQVKIRGFRIEPGEIEAALRDVAGVREVVVVARQDRSEEGARDRRLVAYVVGDVQVEVLRQSLRERLPDYMVPASFVVLPELPLTPNGKVDRKALPAPERQSPEESYLAPRTPVEEILAGIWAEVLGRERVGASDHFFDLGGHSLLATQVISRLRSVFGVEMPLRDLFETPALADFAARIETALRAGTGSTESSLMPALVPVPREGPLPLSFAQQRLWFLYRLEPESGAFHLGSAVRLTGALLPGALAASLGEIVRRHEVLRTRYRESPDGPVQIVDPAAPFPLPVIDLGGLPEGMREPELHGLADREEARPFDLTRSWPLRARLVRLARDEHALLFTLHHIAGDGWSMGLLAREVGMLYARSAGEAAGSAPALPEPPVQYGDYAVWQRGWLSGERLETQLDWWRERLRNPLPVLELPQQRERPDTPGFRGAACSVAVPAGLRRALREIGRREGATLFMVLLAGLKALLHTYSGQEDLIVGTHVANRDRSEIEGLIGFFVNNLALRTDLSGDPTFRELVRRVRDVTLGAFTHQEVPFEKVLEAVQPRRQTAFAPLFQVLFVLQSFPALAWPVRGQEAALLGLETRTANFDLTLSMWEAGDGMAGSLTYDTSLFSAAAMPRMAEHFQALLQGVAEDPDQPLSAILLATEADVQQLASDFNEET